MNEKNKGTAEGVPHDPNIASYISSIIWPSPLAPARTQARASSLMLSESLEIEGLAALNTQSLRCFQSLQVVRMMILVQKGPVVPVRKGLLSRFLNRD